MCLRDLFHFPQSIPNDKPSHTTEMALDSGQEAINSCTQKDHRLVPAGLQVEDHLQRKTNIYPTLNQEKPRRYACWQKQCFFLWIALSFSQEHCHEPWSRAGHPPHGAWKEMVNSTFTARSRWHRMQEGNQNLHLPGLHAGPGAILLVNPDPPRFHCQQTPAFPVQGCWDEFGISGT